MGRAVEADHVRGDPLRTRDGRAASADGGRECVGIACDPGHPVFGVVADRLVARGYAVTFLDADERIERETLADLSALAVKHTRPATLRALVDAERLGVPTWNSATGTMVCASRFGQLCALRGVGFAVPAAGPQRPAGDYVAKGRYHWQPGATVGGEGGVYEELLSAAPVDHKYYAVHDGADYRVRVVRATSKLRGEKHVLGRTAARDDHADRITSLMDRLDMRAVGVDLVRASERWYAVDLNPCPGFAGTGLADAIVDSIASTVS